MACHVSSESGPGGPVVPIRCLHLPVNVIKQAGTRRLQQAPILEASLHKECSSQKQGLTHVSHHQSGQSTHSDRVPALLRSSYFSLFCYILCLLQVQCNVALVAKGVFFFSIIILDRKPHRIKKTKRQVCRTSGPLQSLFAAPSETAAIIY